MNYVRFLLMLFALNIGNDMAPALANSVATNQPRHFASALPNRKGRIQLNRKLKKELNDWFSIFAQSRLQPFGRNDAKDQILIDFALERILRYDELTERVATGEAGVAEKTVDALVAKYFEAGIRQHQPPRRRNDPSSQREYKNGHYFAAASDNASGSIVFEFAKVRRLKGIGHHYYEAEVNVYVGEDGPTEVPVNAQFVRRMRAIFKYTPADTPGKLLLVSYKKTR